MNNLAHIVAQIPAHALRLASSEPFRHAAKEFLVDLGRTVKSGGALISAVRAA